MGAPELLALSLGLSIAVAALGWSGGWLVERMSGDPRLRDRVWAAALILPALPPLGVGLLLLLTPAPVREVMAVSASVPTAVVAAPSGVAVAAAPGFVLDPVLAAWAVLGLAILLTLVRLGALARRAERLARLIREAGKPGPDIAAMVESIAADLAIPAPRTSASAATSEALLASLGRARLILPANLPDPDAARAVIAHELAHLKRGDHRAVWLEEALLVVLAFNPLMPALRTRRAAAREEACDALALGSAAPETRRAYARSLIEALRDRAGPQASGGLPALTFTGAGRNTAMKRLKAVLNPARPAHRAVRLSALALGLGLIATAAAASVAVAGQREESLRFTAPAAPAGSDFAARLPSATAADYQLFCAAAADSMDRMACSMLLWDAALEEQSAATPAFCAANRTDADLTVIAERGRAAVLTGPAGRGSAKDAARRAMIAAFPCQGEPTPVSAAAVDRAAETLGAVWEQQHGEDARAETAARRAAYEAATGADYQRMCASRDPGEDGFCAGVLFRAQMAESRSASPAFCAPEFEGREATGRFVAEAKAGVAQVRVSPGQTPIDVARAGIIRAYPCTAQGREAASAPVMMPVGLELGGDAPVLARDEMMWVGLMDEGRTLIAESVATSAYGRPTPGIEVALTDREFPALNGANRVLTLVGEIRAPDGTVRYRAEPTTIRLAPGSRATARNLGASLSFRPA